MLHRFRLQWARGAGGAKGLDVALAERRRGARRRWARQARRAEVPDERFDARRRAGRRQRVAYVAAACVLVIRTLVACAAWIVVRGRRVGRQLPPEERRWTQ
ncbi:MAG: hypothetical protein R2701_09140 [Acidimicrobiales bacterium]